MNVLLPIWFEPPMLARPYTNATDMDDLDWYAVTYRYVNLLFTHSRDLSAVAGRSVTSATAATLSGMSSNPVHGGEVWPSPMLCDAAVDNLAACLDRRTRCMTKACNRGKEQSDPKRYRHRLVIRACHPDPKVDAFNALLQDPT
ncbi:hypothetical protein CCMA1212_008908 [Trichoderma ghanense]|uniref:Uncharacterized protein n=1 Tax=Trichoderma ghanense TaxID=65468 RepID=A0ABY2GTG1_9HYPO